MTDPTDPAASSDNTDATSSDITDPVAGPDPTGPDSTDPTALATDLREALRPLWRRLGEHRTLSMGKVGILARLDRR
ncbi:hypothetical protein G6027_15300, partial [Dietzia sp. SLG310A2-38A2]|nr:hypothetical protein [Dietzia sp. SLG310A2-38A2]